MPIQRTLSIIKPDATKRNLTGAINERLESKGFQIVAQKRMHLTQKQAQEFYITHKDRPFYNDLVKSMICGPIVAQVLECDDAINKYRQVMGATNPEQADDGTIRKEFAINIESNSVHGSDSIQNADTEISFFFSQIELVG